MLFRDNSVNLGGAQVESILINIQKMEKIYAQIVEVNLVGLIDEEYSLVEEVQELTNSLCIWLKFFEKNEQIPSVSTNKFFSISYEQAIKCTAEELESTMER
jgi:hypothetical protein